LSAPGPSSVISISKTFPTLEKLRLSGSPFASLINIPSNWGIKSRSYQEMKSPDETPFDSTQAQEMLLHLLNNLPFSLTFLDLSISADDLNAIPELPPNLTCLRQCEGTQPATHTARFWLKLPESKRPDLSTLPNFLWDITSTGNGVKASFNTEIGAFGNLCVLDISKTELQSSSDLSNLPHHLTRLDINFWGTTLSMSDISMFPRTIIHLTLHECPWVDDPNNGNDENAKDFCSLLPPMLTYLCMADLNKDWKIETAFSEMRTTLLHLQTLRIETNYLVLDSFDPWLPCDTLHTLELLVTDYEGPPEISPELFSSWPTDIPNNIKRIELSIPNYGSIEDPYEDESLRNLPPQLTSLSLSGRIFRISPGWFASVPKSLTHIDLSETSFTNRISEIDRNRAAGEDDDNDEQDEDDEKDAEDAKEEKEEEEEEEEEEEDLNAIMDNLLVRYCHPHTHLYGVECAFTGTYLPPNTTRLKTNDYDLLDLLSDQLPDVLKRCLFQVDNMSAITTLPTTLTEIDFGFTHLNPELLRNLPHLQRLTLNSLDTSLDFAILTSLKELVIQVMEVSELNSSTSTSLEKLEISYWNSENSTCLLANFPNLTSFTISNSVWRGGQNLPMVFCESPGGDGNEEIESASTTATRSTNPSSSLPTMLKLRHLEVGSRESWITDDHLRRVTPNLTFLSIGYVSVTNLASIYQGLPRDISEIHTIDMIKAICPEISSLGSGGDPEIIYPLGTFDGSDIEKDIGIVSYAPPSTTSWTVPTLDMGWIDHIPSGRLERLEVTSCLPKEFCFSSTTNNKTKIDHLKTLVIHKNVEWTPNDNFFESLPRSVTQLELGCTDPSPNFKFSNLPPQLISFSMPNMDISRADAEALPSRLESLNINSLEASCLDILPPTLKRLDCQHLHPLSELSKKKLLETMKRYPSLVYFPVGASHITSTPLDDETLAFYKAITSGSHLTDHIE
jgi:hypothetical protein